MRPCASIMHDLLRLASSLWCDEMPSCRRRLLLLFSCWIRGVGFCSALRRRRWLLRHTHTRPNDGWCMTHLAGNECVKGVRVASNDCRKPMEMRRQWGEMIVPVAPAVMTLINSDGISYFGRCFSSSSHLLSIQILVLIIGRLVKVIERIKNPRWNWTPLPSMVFTVWPEMMPSRRIRRVGSKSHKLLFAWQLHLEQRSLDNLYIGFALILCVRRLELYFSVFLHRATGHLNVFKWNALR